MQLETNPFSLFHLALLQCHFLFPLVSAFLEKTIKSGDIKNAGPVIYLVKKVLYLIFLVIFACHMQRSPSIQSNIYLLIIISAEND